MSNTVTPVGQLSAGKKRTKNRARRSCGQHLRAARGARRGRNVRAPAGVSMRRRDGLIGVAIELALIGRPEAVALREHDRLLGYEATGDESAAILAAGERKRDLGDDLATVGTGTWHPPLTAVGHATGDEPQAGWSIGRSGNRRQQPNRNANRATASGDIPHHVAGNTRAASRETAAGPFSWVTEPVSDRRTPRVGRVPRPRAHTGRAPERSPPYSPVRCSGD